METTMFWMYLANATLLIVHEIDSAYWQKWKLINPKDENGITGFLLIHIPVVAAMLYGVHCVSEISTVAVIYSAATATCGLFAYIFHQYHLRKGRQEFNVFLSKALLFAILILSIAQVIMLFFLFANGLV